MDDTKDIELNPIQLILLTLLILLSGIYFAFKGNILDLVGNINFRLLKEFDLIGFMYANLRSLFVLTVLGTLLSTVKTKNAMLGLVTTFVLCTHVFVFGVREIFLTETACIQHAEVKEVGPCDSSGHCKAKVEDGRFIEILKPMAGETICSKEENRVHARYSWLFAKH